MSISTIAIYPAEAAFDPVDAYYTMFQYEVSETKDVHALSIIRRMRLPNLTFELLLDTLIELRKTTPDIDTYLIVVHGLHDANDVAMGLALPLAQGTTVRTFAKILEGLLPFVDGDPSADGMSRFDKKTGVFDAQNNPISLPAGLSARLVGKMRTLRGLKVRKVEFRACTLGNQPDVMEIVGRCFGARFIYAPDVHMFYVRINPGRRVRPALMTQFARNRHDARQFADGSERLGISVQGTGVGRVSTAMTSSADLHWFTDGLIWSANGYPRGTPQPAPFVLAGMDVPAPLRFALPLEPDYPKHIVCRGPLKGNQI
jgi:hypothetical protein